MNTLVFIRKKGQRSRRTCATTFREFFADDKGRITNRKLIPRPALHILRQRYTHFVAHARFTRTRCICRGRNRRANGFFLRYFYVIEIRVVFIIIYSILECVHVQCSYRMLVNMHANGVSLHTLVYDIMRTRNVFYILYHIETRPTNRRDAGVDVRKNITTHEHNVLCTTRVLRVSCRIYCSISRTEVHKPPHTFRREETKRNRHNKLHRKRTRHVSRRTTCSGRAAEK